ncbi:MAG: hypothetical protein VX278_12445 [Myxococcota bacterium]|nr:hypothetical protein [Myxococcota bacterium]
MTPFLMGIVGSPEMDDAWSNHMMKEIVACEKEQDRQEVFSDGKHLVYKHLTVGERPENGHSVYIALHDRTSSDFHENEQQWSYMLQRYHTSLREGLYIVPRNHFEKNDLFREQWAYPLIDRLIECLIITGEVMAAACANKSKDCSGQAG